METKNILEQKIESKYYTPEISEFYLGFEYDFLQRHGSPEQEWVSLKLDCISDGEDDARLGLTFKALENYDNIYIRNAWRVKYLNQEDIESFGFEFKEYNEIAQKTVYEKVWNAGLCPVIYRLTTYSSNEDGTHVHINIHSCDRFNGQIKNKSELALLLKMLGAEDLHNKY